MSDFTESFKKLVDNEGGYTVDSGGATMYGITERVARAYGYQGPMQEIPIETALNIAKLSYWYKWFDDLPQGIADEFLDCKYNMGNGFARVLQRALAVTVDGIIGPNTLKALEFALCTDKDKLMLAFFAYRIKYYTSLETFNDYGKGWSNRVAKNMLGYILC